MKTIDGTRQYSVPIWLVLKKSQLALLPCLRALAASLPRVAELLGAAELGHDCHSFDTSHDEPLPPSDQNTEKKQGLSRLGNYARPRAWSVQTLHNTTLVAITVAPRADISTNSAATKTCFASLKSARDLRSHVRACQFEANQLSTRIQEVQLHLPAADGKHSNGCNDGSTISHVRTAIDVDDDGNNGDDGDNGDDGNDDDYDSDNSDNGYDGNGSHDGSDDGDDGEDADKDDDDGDEDGIKDNLSAQLGKGQSVRCPHPGCKRNTIFKSIGHVLRHYTIPHVRCSELCVYYREPFTHARKYISHKCKFRGRNKAKALQAKEQRSQLRKLAKTRPDRERTFYKRLKRIESKDRRRQSHSSLERDRKGIVQII
ncbi:uncharacterized protein MKZ38_000196 [Zalerion maritima]|uniref:Uncharacterized protein n=1 Tax=Zalerion maritima TaxID=339359 RepID=A0AAD5WSP0_9PEZI|nr:uncharacterized protein MKZ38_000196 [Zalerion maritima]